MNTEFDPVIYWPTVTKLTGLSRRTLTRMRAAGEFPAPGKMAARRVGWRRSKVEAWIASRLDA